MGCNSSKDAEQPQKTIIIQQSEPVQHVIPIDNGGASVINERRRIQVEEEDKFRREALEFTESKKREASLRAVPRNSNKEKHSKVLDAVDDKYKGLQSKFILLRENLRKNDREDREIATLNQYIKSDARDIENSVEDLQTAPFPNDKEYIRGLKKIIQFSKTLDSEYQQLKKKTQKYPDYKRTVLELLQDQYADLFDESMTMTQRSVRKSGVLMSPRSELKAASTKTSPSRNYNDRPVIRDERVPVRVGEPILDHGVVAVVFDDPFDREMAAVMEKQRDDAAFELENAVHEYERIQMDFNVLKTRQDNLQKDYRAAQLEIKELQHGNKHVMNLNNAMGAENGSFKERKNEVVRKHEQTKQNCVAFERELAELRAVYTQKVAERDLIDQEHEFKVNQLEYEIKRKQEEARDIDRSRKDEDVRLREDERRILDDERRREENERKLRDIDRKRQEDDRRRVEEERIRKEEVRRVEARIEEVDRQRRNFVVEPVLPPVVSDFSVSVPVVRNARGSVHIIPANVTTVLPPLYPGEVERKLQEDVRRIQMMNEESDRKRAQMMNQLNMPVIVGVSNNMPVMNAPVNLAAPIRFEDIVLPNKYTSMTAEPPMRSSLVGDYPIVSQPPMIINGAKNFVVENERPKMEGALSALEMARRTRMGTDRNQVVAAMDHKRLEVQNVPINYPSGFGY